MAFVLTLYIKESNSCPPSSLIHSFSMWKAAEWGVSIFDMSDKKNATFAAHEAATFDVSQSLNICKQLLEHSWQSYNNEHYHLVWQEALDTAIEGCKGLLTMSTEKHVQELQQEAHM